MLYDMETQERKIQTAFRLRPSLLERIKKEASFRKQSVNAYVETVLERETQLIWPKLPKEFFEEPEDLFNCKGHIPSPTKEMLETDPKLAHIWNIGA